MRENRYLTLKAWRDICQLKIYGGLGFRLFKDFNTTLLAKLGWKIIKGKESLWANMMGARYFRQADFFSYVFIKNDSLVWKGILSCQKALRKGVCYKVGNVLSINLWRDPWIP